MQSHHHLTCFLLLAMGYETSFQLSETCFIESQKQPTLVWEVVNDGCLGLIPTELQWAAMKSSHAVSSSSIWQAHHREATKKWTQMVKTFYLVTLCVFIFLFCAQTKYIWVTEVSLGSSAQQEWWHFKRDDLARNGKNPTREERSPKYLWPVTQLMHRYLLSDVTTPAERNLIWTDRVTRTHFICTSSLQSLSCQAHQGNYFCLVEALRSRLQLFTQCDLCVRMNKRKSGRNNNAL